MNLKIHTRLLGATLLVVPAALFAQLSIDRHTIDGGGGTSSGGLYSVVGTIGQPDAGGPMTNGQFSVTGGFWALPIVVQTADAPTLIIARAGPGLAMISWSPSSPGFVLQETLSLSPTNWINSPSGATNPITVPFSLRTKFYRLFTVQPPNDLGLAERSKADSN